MCVVRRFVCTKEVGLLTSVKARVDAVPIATFSKRFAHISECLVSTDSTHQLTFKSDVIVSQPQIKFTCHCGNQGAVKMTRIAYTQPMGTTAKEPRRQCVEAPSHHTSWSLAQPPAAEFRAQPPQLTLLWTLVPAAQMVRPALLA